MELIFYSDRNCGHCRQLHATLTRIIEERKITMTIVNVDRKTHDLDSVPAVAVLHKGEEIGRFHSALSKEFIDIYLNQLQKYIDLHLSDKKGYDDIYYDKD